MNDRYLYRAKRKSDKQWICGNLIQTDDGVYIIQNYVPQHLIGNYEVDPSTICQCTGLKDKNGKLIWENDIVRHEDLTNGRYITRKQPMKNSVIKWNCKEAKFERSDRRDIYKSESRLDVVGNVFDNPELFEVGE